MSTGDNVIPGSAPADAWEVPATLNHTWGYRKDDHDWKSPGDVTFKLVDIVSKGGNYLLNVGPMADGVIPKESQDTLRDGGAVAQDQRGGRLRHAGRARGATSSESPAPRARRTCAASRCSCPATSGASTTKPGKLYFTFFQEPRVPFELPPMKNAVKRAYQLADGAPVEDDDGRVAARRSTSSGPSSIPRPPSWWSRSRATRWRGEGPRSR